MRHLLSYSVVAIGLLFTAACGEDKAVLEAAEKQYVYDTVNKIFGGNEPLVHKRAYLGCEDKSSGRACSFCDVQVDFDDSVGMVGEAAVVEASSGQKGYLHKTQEVELNMGVDRESFFLSRVSTQATTDMISQAEAWCELKGARSFLTIAYDGDGLRAANDS